MGDSQKWICQFVCSFQPVIMQSFLCGASGPIPRETDGFPTFCRTANFPHSRLTQLSLRHNQGFSWGSKWREHRKQRIWWMLNNLGKCNVFNPALLNIHLKRGEIWKLKSKPHLSREGCFWLTPQQSRVAVGSPFENLIFCGGWAKYHSK